jgi:asparagine synthase (glutamine-hydrolysing)
MCGIAGALGWGNDGPPAVEALGRMLGALRHRGPDEFGIYRDEVAALAHARLSIIDLATGQQPLANEDRTVWTVFNGEIFNYVELREELVGLGHRFRTASDTEVIVHAWEQWGEASVERFNGQWALAVWDAPRRRLFLSRDRLGVRPIYHATVGQRFFFASEVKAIFTDASVPRAIDPAGLDQIFTFWTTVAPRTPFVGVDELPPGHNLVLELPGSGAPSRRTRRYWEPSYVPADAPAPMSLDDATDALLEKLETATRLRMLRADVPVGAYLSGGIDSSVTAALGRRAKEGVFKTFSLRFADAEFDETEYQRIMSRTLDSAHEEVLCERRDIARVFPDVVRHTERPVLRTAPAPMYLLSGLVRAAGFKVVLTGEGSDEILAGYDLFREAKVRGWWARQPGSQRRPLLLGKLYPYLKRSPTQSPAMACRFFGQGLDRADRPEFGHQMRWDSASGLKRLFSPGLRDAVRGVDAVAELTQRLPDDFDRWDLVSRVQYLEVRTLLSGYLLSSQGDRMLMAHSVEGRFPFLDHDVVTFCNSLPSRYKLRVLDEKHLLKRAARDLVPREILERPKQPYRAPDAASFVGEGAPAWIDDVLDPSAIREAGLFEPAAVAALAAKCRARAGAAQIANADNMAFVGILSTQLLWRDFVRTAPSAPPVGAGEIGTQAP